MSLPVDHDPVHMLQEWVSLGDWDQIRNWEIRTRRMGPNGIFISCCLEWYIGLKPLCLEKLAKTADEAVSLALEEFYKRP